MLNRRNFIFQSTLASMAIAACSHPMSKNSLAGTPIGLQLYSVREQCKPGNLESVFENIARAGYTEVEMFGLDDDNKFFGYSVQEVKQMLLKNKLTSPSGHYMPAKFLFEDGNGDDVKNLCDIANQLGSNYVTIPWMSPEKRSNIDQYKALAERLNKAGEICKTFSKQLAYHNHDFEFTDYNGEHGYDVLLRQTDPSLLEMEMDIYWVVFAGYDPLQLFAANPGRFHMWHVKDMSKTDRTKNTEVGNGQVDFKKIFGAAKQSGVRHYIVEQENNYAPDLYGSIAKSNDYVKSLLVKA